MMGKIFELPNKVLVTLSPMKLGNADCLNPYLVYEEQYYPPSLLRKAISGLIEAAFTFSGCTVYGVLLKRNEERFIGQVKDGSSRLALDELDALVFNRQV